MDKFKNILKKKVTFEPIPNDQDAQIWEILEGKIDRLEGRSRKTKWLYTYAAAASILLITTLYVLNRSPRTDQTAIVKESNSEEKLSSDTVTYTVEHTMAPEQHPDPKPQNGHTSAASSYEHMDDVQVMATPHVFKKSERTKRLTTTRPTYFELLDHSIVVLNKDAKLYFNESYLSSREVLLEGQGYFEVTHDPSRAFKVYFHNTHLIVLGTKFYIQNVENDSEQRVVVTEGRVKVYDPQVQQYITLTKGQELILKQNSKAVVHDDIANASILWKKGTLMFDGTKLEDVFHALHNELGVHIKYDPNIADCIFSGNLSDMSLKDALGFIKITTNIVVEQKDDHIFVTGNPCD